MANDTKVVFDTIGKLAGVNVIYDPDLQARRIPFEVSNATLEQALDIAALESKTFWKPITENTIMVIPDQTQKRRDYEEQVVRTFYLNNMAVAQDLTEIMTGLRQLLDLKRISQVNAQNAIIVRDTPDKLELIDKIIKDIDKAKPEVIIQVEILQASTDNLKNLGNSAAAKHQRDDSIPNTSTQQQFHHDHDDQHDQWHPTKPIDASESERRGINHSERHCQFPDDRFVH